MEGVPRIPMLAFEMKLCSESVEFTPELKSYISSYYHENADSYSKECAELDQLRQSAAQVKIDFMGCSLLKKYYSQLQLLHSRFPMASGEAIEVTFKWDDAYTHQTVAVKDIRFEQACILYNIGALHSILGGMDNRTTPEGMKVSCTHFQCAAWAFQQLIDAYGSFGSFDLSHEILTFKSTLMLAQAQECILEKSMTDSRKSSITAKVAAQIVDYYKLALRNLDASNPSNIIGSKRYKDWRRRLETKTNFYQCIMYLYLGTQSEEQQKWGERLTYFQAALDRLNEAIKLNKAEDAGIEDSLRFTLDVVGGKYNAAKKDNDFVYHDKVPALDTLPEVKGAPLVKGIPFNPNDPEVSGPDIFKKLVPMEAHKSSSLYSEEKAKLLRRVGANIEEKDNELDQFISSLHLDPSSIFPEPQKLPQALLEKCAAISVKPDAIKDLIDAMQSLSGISTDVEGNLQEIGDLLDEHEKKDREMKEVFGTKRSSNAVLDEIRKDLQKCTEGLTKAAASNNELNKLMRLHITNLRLLSGPLEELQKALPTYGSSGSAEDEATKQEMKRLMDKVDEMKNQRRHLEQQLRDQVLKDDITSTLVTKESKNLEEFFEEQLGKHNRMVDLLNQNMAAQANILRALTEANAKYAHIRRDRLEVDTRRDAMVRAIIQSYEVYEDLLAKTQKGVEFYGKLDSNVSRLLERTRSVCKIEQEERDKILERLAPKGPPPARPTAPKPGQFPLPTPVRMPDPSLGLPEMSLPMLGQFSGGPSYGPGGVSPYVGEATSDAPKLKDFLPFMKPGSFGPKSTKAGIGEPRSDTFMNSVGMPLPGEMPVEFDYRRQPVAVSSQQPGSLPNSHSASPVHLPQLSASHPPSPLTIPGQYRIPQTFQAPGSASRTDTNAGSNAGFVGIASGMEATAGMAFLPSLNNGHQQGPVGGATGSVGGATGSVGGATGIGTDSIVSPTAPPGAPGSSHRVDKISEAPVSGKPLYTVAHPGGPSEQPAGPQVPQSGQHYPLSSAAPQHQSSHFPPGQTRADALPSSARGGEAGSYFTSTAGYAGSQPRYPSSQCLPAQSQPGCSYEGVPGTSVVSPSGGYYPEGVTYAVASSIPGVVPSVPRAADGWATRSYTGPTQTATSGPYGPGVVQYSANGAQVPYYQPGQGLIGQGPSGQASLVQGSIGQGQQPQGQGQVGQRPQGPVSFGQGPLGQGPPGQAYQAQGPLGQGMLGPGQIGQRPLPNQVSSYHGAATGAIGSNLNLQFTARPQYSGPAGVGHNQPYPVPGQQYLPSGQQGAPQNSPAQMHSHQQTIRSSVGAALPSGGFQGSVSGSPLHPDGNQPVRPPSVMGVNTGMDSRIAPLPSGVSQSYTVPGGPYQPRLIGTSSYQQPQPVGTSSYQQPQNSYQQPQPVGTSAYQQPQNSYQPPQPVGASSYQQPQNSYQQQPRPVGVISYQQPQNSYQQQPQAIGTYQQPTGTEPYQLRPGSYQQPGSISPQTLASALPGTSAYQQLPQSGINQPSHALPASSQQQVLAYSGSSQQAPVPSGTSQQTSAYSGASRQVAPYPGTSQQAPVPSGASQQVSAYAGAVGKMPVYPGNNQQMSSGYQVPVVSGAGQQVSAYPGPSHQTQAYPATSQPGPAHPGGNQQAYPAVQPSLPTQAHAAGLSYQATTYGQGQIVQPTYPTAAAAAGMPVAHHSAPSNWYPPNSFQSPTQEMPSSLPSPLQPVKPLPSDSSASSTLQPSGGTSSDVAPVGAFHGAASTDGTMVPYSSQPNAERRSSVSSNTSSTLDELLSASPKIQPLSSGSENVLIPKVITAEDRRREKEEETRKNLKQSSRDPYTDPDLLGRFVADVEKFQKHVDALCKETLGKYTPLEKEWKELNDEQEKTAKQFSMAIARCYPLKNRFPDVMPFDNTRVKLTGVADDYINASHLTSETVSCPEFIATQSPLPATFVDFWQMIHDQGTEVIVMLCAEVEAGTKNQPYWPQEKGQTIVHGSFHLTLQSIKVKPDWIERILTISHKTTRQSRSIVHLQFLKWPPAGVPESPAALLQFTLEVHNFYIQQRSLMKPVVVHCSNGIGRTGAFCVIYTGIQEINQGHGIINIPELVASLRQKRKFLVQHKEQLKFCYDAVLYYAQDLLMKRGILTTKASFGDKLPHPGEKIHCRNPSEDFVFGHSNILSLQSSLAKLSTHQQSTQSQAVTAESNAHATTLSSASESPPSVPEALEETSLPKDNDVSKTTTPVDIPSSSTNGKEVGFGENGSGQSSLAMPTDTLSALERSASSSATNSRASSASPSLGQLPLSLADLQNPSTFQMDVSQPTKKKITRASFLNPSRSLAEGSVDPSDPLSQLDPLWSLKDKSSKS